MISKLDRTINNNGGDLHQQRQYYVYVANERDKSGMGKKEGWGKRNERRSGQALSQSTYRYR